MFFITHNNWKILILWIWKTVRRPKSERTFVCRGIPTIFQTQKLSFWNDKQPARRHQCTCWSVWNNVWWSSDMILILSFHNFLFSRTRDFQQKHEDESLWSFSHVSGTSNDFTSGFRILNENLNFDLGCCNHRLLELTFAFFQPHHLWETFWLNHMFTKFKVRVPIRRMESFIYDESMMLGFGTQ